MQIGELAKRSGLTASRIRFYEAKGPISVTRRANGYRAYSAETLVALNIIAGAQDAGFTLGEIRCLMSGDLSGCRRVSLLEQLELTADPSTARQQQIGFVPAPFMLRFALLPAFSF